MSEYLIQGETLTSIADEARELMGTSAPLTPSSITEHLQFVNAATETQANEISSMIALIEEKAANTATLQTKAVNISTNGTTQFVPDSGYDGMSGITVVTAVPTASTTTVKLSPTGSTAAKMWCFGASATVYENGEFNSVAKNNMMVADSDGGMTFENVVSGSMIHLHSQSVGTTISNVTFSYTNAEEVYDSGMTNSPFDGTGKSIKVTGDTNNATVIIYSL